MLQYLPLLWANLQRKKLRTSLTLASIAIAFLLFGTLETLRVAMTGAAQVIGADRMFTTHKMSLVMSMPQAYVNKVRGVPGVEVVCAHAWFGGMGKKKDGEEIPVPAFAIDAASLLETYPEFGLTPAQRRDFLSDRGAAIVSSNIARQFDWKVGDIIPLRSNIFVRKEGGNAWNLRIAAIFDGNQGLYLHYEYFNEARTLARDSIGWMVLRVSDPNRVEEVGRTIDGLFTNASPETKTATERAFAQGFANQTGNIAAIVAAVASAVFFTMLLVTANTMAESVRERTNEIGVLKTLGFSSLGVTLLVLGEALLLTLLGAGIGLGLATLSALGLSQSPATEQIFPTTVMPPESYATGAAIALVLGVLAAVVPCLRAWQLQITEALRKA